MHWANEYVGKPWTVDGYGPDEFNCWGLLWWVQRKHFGRELHKYQISPDDRLTYMRVMSDVLASAEWERTYAPADGAPAAMSSSVEIHHVGTFLDVDGGKILHAVKGKGVLCQTIPAVRLMFPRIEFYHFTKWPKSPKPASLKSPIRSCR